MDNSNAKFLSALFIGVAAGYSIKSILEKRKTKKKAINKPNVSPNFKPMPPPSDGATPNPWDLVYRDYKLVDTFIDERIKIDEIMVMRIPMLSDYIDESMNQIYENINYIQSRKKETLLK